MGFPMLVAAIRSSGLPQYRIAECADIRDYRLSRIVTRGGATPEERRKLADLLGVTEAVLFGPGLPVRLRADQPEVEEVRS